MNVAAYTYNNKLWAIIYIIVDIWSYCAFYACLAYIVWGFVTWYRLRDE